MQFLSEKDSASKFRQNLSSASFVNTTLGKVENILIAAAKRCLKIRRTKKRRHIEPLSNKKWFDRDCRLKKHELRKLSNQKHRDPLNVTLRKKYHTVLTEYKKLLCKKRAEYYNSKVSELEETTKKSG